MQCKNIRTNNKAAFISQNTLLPCTSYTAKLPSLEPLLEVSRVQVMVGFGSPDASQNNVTWLPTAELRLPDVLIRDGDTEHKIKTF